MAGELDKVFERCQAIDDKYDKKIEALDKKYDDKNEKVIERFVKVSDSLTNFIGPMAEMGADVENNSIRSKANEIKLDSFKNKIFWTMVSAIGAMILLAINILVKVLES